MSGSLFDFGLYFFHNAHGSACARAPVPISICRRWRVTWKRGCGTTSSSSRRKLGIPNGTIRAHRADRNHSRGVRDGRDPLRTARSLAGLNCGRWDYIFSFIKKFRDHADCVCPTARWSPWTRHFLKSYVDLLIQTCHRAALTPWAGWRRRFRSRTIRPPTTQRSKRCGRINYAKSAPDTTAPGSRIRGWFRRRNLRRADDGPESDRRAARGVTVTAADLSGSRGHYHRSGLAMEHRRRHCNIWNRGWADRLRTDLQPDGGRRHGRNLSRASLAVAPQPSEVPIPAKQLLPNWCTK